MDAIKIETESEIDDVYEATNLNISVCAVWNADFMAANEKMWEWNCIFQFLQFANSNKTNNIISLIVVCLAK